MRPLARIAIVTCLSGLSLAGLWWLFGRFGSVFGFPGSMDVPPWIVGVSAALLAGCGEAWRVVIEYRVARKNREVADQIGCTIIDSVSAAEIRSWPQVSLFRNDSPSGSNRMTTLCGMVNQLQQQIIEFQNAQTETLLKKPGKKRLLLNDDQQRALAVKPHAIGRKALLELTTFVTTDTILRWHRELVARKFDSSEKRPPGRPRIRQDVVDAIVRFAIKNPTW